MRCRLLEMMLKRWVSDSGIPDGLAADRRTPDGLASAVKIRA